MSRTVWISLGAALCIVVVLVLIGQFAAPPPAVRIDTPGAKVEIGSGGVSVSVAPSEP